ncbi:MAG: glycosyltransferase [Candidatus Weimeria sp.]
MKSVVIALYNGEKYITEQLDSIREQTCPADEVILCDDCSTDQTINICTEYIKKYKLTSWKLHENKENLGFFDNFINGLFMSRGDTVYLGDQDDIWDLKKIEKIEKIFTDKSIMLVESNYKYIDSEGNDLLNGKVIRENPGISELSFKTMCKYAGPGFTMAIRRDVIRFIQNNGLYLKKDLFLFHDILLGLSAAAIGTCCLDSEVIDSHRLHESNQTRRIGKSYASDRTKADQISIVSRRKKYFHDLSECVTGEKSDIFKRFSEFAAARESLITHFNLKQCNFLMHRRDYYASRYGVYSDILYSLGAEKILTRIFSYKKI